MQHPYLPVPPKTESQLKAEAARRAKEHRIQTVLAWATLTSPIWVIALSVATGIHTDWILGFFGVIVPTYCWIQWCRVSDSPDSPAP